ncbi:hypothetical protein EI94DRAFT_1703958 [Lactarius quietus]|nr:hypothetical protein EI94DRAFT_1703958 [Lactarius quietus]
MAPRPTPPLPPLLLPVPVVVELDQIAEMLANAFLNHVPIGWDAVHYSQYAPKVNHQKESKGTCNTKASLEKRYPPRSDLAANINLSSPCVIVDIHGVILAWHLPCILTEARQGQMLAVTQKLRQLLQASLNTKSWHGKKHKFQVGSELPTGVENFSAAWHEQGHELPSAAEQHSNEIPRASVNFRNPDSIHCLESMSESNSILSAILSIIHPALYSAGSYQDCNLKLPGLGISLEYGPGTVVGFSGKMLEHGVPKFNGERYQSQVTQV